ncbi:MAG TPA: AAA family ATPase [Herpetosiphonaceae bacterium]
MSDQTFSGFAPDDLATLGVPGVAERWAAVQARLHPILAALAERIDHAARQRFPRQWPLYEISYKSVRYVNRGGRRRDPIDEYHLVIDRPPRGAGIYVGVSGAEQRVLVGLQLWRSRKAELAELWISARPIWEELIANLPDVRFTGGDGGDGLWIDEYLASGANYLWAGFSYPWAEAVAGGTAFGDRLINDVLALLPLNEALMEAGEGFAVPPVRQVREQAALYGAGHAAPPVEAIIDYVNARGFVYPDELLRSYHVALHTKPLVILPGISGTGKTRLTRLYADAVHGIAPQSDNPFYLAVAVQPDWHNARDLLGYYNALTGRFQPTPFLRFMLRAAADPAQPYYVCLDELNLARPEYYLAPILSALETAEHSIDLGIPAETAETATGEMLRNPLRLPLNLHLTGTVNVDESTFALSDKLLDRANVIELTEVDLAAFRQRYAGPVNERAWELLTRAAPILAAAGHPFGYRVAAELLRYLETASGVLDETTAIDLQLKQKLLPKLRGEDTPRFRRALRDLQALFAAYPQSAAKVAAMLERLEREGYADFYA